MSEHTDPHTENCKEKQQQQHQRLKQNSVFVFCAQKTTKPRILVLKRDKAMKKERKKRSEISSSSTSLPSSSSVSYIIMFDTALLCWNGWTHESMCNFTTPYSEHKSCACSMCECVLPASAFIFILIIHLLFMHHQNEKHVFWGRRDTTVFLHIFFLAFRRCCRSFSLSESPLLHKWSETLLDEQVSFFFIFFFLIHCYCCAASFFCRLFSSAASFIIKYKT